MQSLYTSPDLGGFSEPQVSPEREEILLLVPRAVVGGAQAVRGFLLICFMALKLLGCHTHPRRRKKMIHVVGV